MIDTHAHIFDPQFDSDRDQIISRAISSGVTRMILPAIDWQSHEVLMETLRNNPTICYGAIGLHPTHVNSNLDFRGELNLIKQSLEANHSQWVAIGETGLDLYHDVSFLDQQREAFEYQIELSIGFDLPLIIHSRNAWDQVFEILEPYQQSIRGVFHSFTGDGLVLERILSMPTFYVGIGGIITYKNSDLDVTIRNCPLNRIVLETDAPYLAPTPNRGKRNEPSMLPLIAQKVAESLGVSTSTLKMATTENAMNLFF